jgi:hypothetical protein
MKTKICSRCKKRKRIISFHVNAARKDGYANYCKQCDREYHREHYIKNKQYYKEKCSKYRNAHVEWYKELKSKLKCEECGENHIACLVFHHKDPTKKKFNIAKCIRELTPKKRILEEIKKCRVLCSNCHRKWHYEND